MESRFENLRPGVFVLALAISIFIWFVAQGTSSVIQSFDVEVELVGLEDGLVVTDQSSDEVNVRLRGSRAALRNLDTDQLKYRIDAGGGKPGVAVYDVDVDTTSKSIPHSAPSARAHAGAQLVNALAASAYRSDARHRVPALGASPHDSASVASIALRSPRSASARSTESIGRRARVEATTRREKRRRRRSRTSNSPAIRAP